MVERAAEDYAKIIQSVNPEREINPICTNIEDMLTRLDEFETLLSNIKAETNSMLENHVSAILGFTEHFDALRSRIDNLEKFVEVVNNNVTAVENSLDIAEEELHVTDYSIKGLIIKPLLAKAKATTVAVEGGEQLPRSNLVNGEFQKIPIFSTDKYFKASTSDLLEDEPKCDLSNAMSNKN
ncbi:biogenesis of lysosome-related organelles complex 1 subunit 4 [Teleopsis dalmanni]|uniref:biogenesis of lysosome-related organelles complex 1 subunit 4 n=1 Tax=Teleopsis dalmanni TaxID=139649 RepID=UPI0018CE5BB8|nr:biogenesis of lysosome-related organelles complex 1 subunit 4 [Teleopsis dalmanni]XP_037934207.1 biogenesis of lysosome-related organelles complex 1 subunit 4 [Teleopsis dalmanni]